MPLAAALQLLLLLHQQHGLQHLSLQLHDQAHQHQRHLRQQLQTCTGSDSGFLGVANLTDPTSCERMCHDYINGECNSVMFQPFNWSHPSGLGVCELWRYTVEEYHGNCTWLSGRYFDNLDRCNFFDYDCSLPCQVKNFTHNNKNLFYALIKKPWTYFLTFRPTG